MATATWPIKPTTGGGDWELPPAGNMAAVCVALIDLGTQQDSYQGVPKENHQMVIVWELAGMVSAKTGKNHLVCERFNVSLHPKANLRKTLESWRGVPIKDDEEFDVFKIVGAPCLIQVSHDITKSGNEIYSIDAVTGLPKGMAKAAPTYPLTKYRIIEGPLSVPVLDWLPLVYGKKIADLILACVEFRARPPAASGATGYVPINPPPPQEGEIPFSWMIGMIATGLAAFGMVA